MLNHYTISQYQAGVERLELSLTVLETGMLPLHHTPIIFQRPCTDDWVRTNDLQNMSLLLLPTELHQYLEQSKGIEPSLFLLGREMPYH